MIEQRRLAAIVSADIVSYSRLCERLSNIVWDLRCAAG